jgi:AcrR family transcriptional regulator
MVPSAVVADTGAWIDLDPEDKRRRLRGIAAAVFTEQGLEAPMPAIAAAAGIGVGSLYRCYGSKDELIAAIVVEQMRSVRARILAADGRAEPGPVLEETLRDLVEYQAENHVVRAAMAATSDRPEVEDAVDRVSLAWQALLDRARSDGAIRADATVTDLRLIFAATHAADEFQSGARGRMLALLLDALRGGEARAGRDEAGSGRR